MGMGRIDVSNPAFWRGWVSTVQAEAGEALGLKTRNEEVFKERCRTGDISTDYRPTVYTFVFQERQSTFWDLFRSSRSTTIINNYNAPASRATPQTKEEKEAEKNKKQADTAKVIGSLFAIAGAFLVGFVYKKWDAQWEATKYTKAVQGAIELQTDERGLSGELSDIMWKLEKIVSCQLRIDTLKSQKITGYFRATIGLFVGSLVWAGGGFAVSPAFMTMGKVILLFSAIIAAGNCGLHWGDEKTIETLRYEIVGNFARGQEGLANQILCKIWTLPAQRSQGGNREEEVHHQEFPTQAAEGIPVTLNPETGEYLPLYPYGMAEYTN